MYSRLEQVWRSLCIALYAEEHSRTGVVRSAHDAEVRSAEVAALFEPQRVDYAEQSQHHYVLPQIVAELHAVQENKLESVCTSAVEHRAN